MAEHETTAQEVQIPPYFDRYQEERDRRVQSELHRVEESIERNGRRIDELREDMDRRFGELREGMGQRFDDTDRRFGDTDRRIDELRKDMDRRFDQLGMWIKFTFGIVATGTVAILVKLFVG